MEVRGFRPSDTNYLSIHPPPPAWLRPSARQQLPALRASATSAPSLPPPPVLGSARTPVSSARQQLRPSATHPPRVSNLRPSATHPPPVSNLRPSATHPPRISNLSPSATHPPPVSNLRPSGTPTWRLKARQILTIYLSNPPPPAPGSAPQS